jgi:hypothetical protein
MSLYPTVLLLLSLFDLFFLFGHAYSLRSSKLSLNQPRCGRQNCLPLHARRKIIKSTKLPSESVENDNYNAVKPSPKSFNGIDDEILADILSMSAKQSNNLASSSQSEGANSVITGLKNVFSAVLIADFFLILLFLAWFLAAVALQSAMPVVLEKFQGIFQPVVVPSLTVLMAGSIASGVLGDKDKGNK